MSIYNQYDSFVLSKDINPAVREGMTGVILEVWSDNYFEVEFVKKDGRNIEFEGLGVFTIDKSYIK